MPTRVAVFIDYQNVYKRAREVFSLRSEPHPRGQVHPFALGYELAVQRGPEGQERDLQEVRIYRGLPDARRDPQGNAACNRQLDFWESLPKVEAIKRPLNYPPPGSSRPVREKGIDVQLAIDLVMGAVTARYDVAVVFSADTDLVPALDAVLELRGPGSVEVASWRSDQRWTSRLKATRHQIWCHYLERSVFDVVCDDHDYNTGSHPS